MRGCWVVALVALACLAMGGKALAQQTSAASVNATVVAERDAGNAAMALGERLGNAGQKGADSEACKQITRAMSHYHAAAVAAGLMRDGQFWATLSQEQMTALERMTGIRAIVRHERYREAICQG